MYVSDLRRILGKLFRHRRMNIRTGCGAGAISAGTATRMCGSPAPTLRLRMRMPAGFPVTGGLRLADTSGLRDTGPAKRFFALFTASGIPLAVVLLRACIINE